MNIGKIINTNTTIVSLFATLSIKRIFFKKFKLFLLIKQNKRFW